MALTAAQIKVVISADITGATRGLATVQKKLGSFAGSAAMVGGALTLGVTAPLVGVAKQALDTATAYQTNMNILQAVTGASAGQMVQMSQKAIALGADVSLPATSAADAAQAMNELAKAGLSVNQTMGAAKGVLELSAAGDIDNATAAQIAADALNTFHLSGSKATEVANLLAASANASSGSVQDMSDALAQGASSFAAAHQPIDALVTAISEMSNAGIQGGMAGAALKEMMLKLEAPSAQAAGEMKQLGLNIYDAQGKMIPFRDIISQFTTKLGPLTDQQKQYALTTIFGARASQSANIVLMGGVKAYDAMHAAVTKQNAALTLADARMKGLGGAFENLKSQVETLILQGTLPFMGTLETIVRDVANLIPKIATINPHLLAAAGAFLAVLAAAGPVLLLLGLLAGALAFLISPIGLIVSGVAALAAAWASDFGGIREKTAAVVGFILPILEGVAAWFAANWPAMQAVVLNAFHAIQSVIQTVIGTVAPFITREMTVVTTWWHANMPLMQKTAETIFHAIQAVINFVMPYIQQLIQTILPIIAGFWQVEWQGMQAALTFVWNVMEVLIDATIHTILDVITLVMDVITGNWSGAWAMIKDIVKIEWDTIKQVVNLALVFLRDGIVNPILNQLGTNWTDAWNGIGNTLSGVWNGMIGTVKNGINSIVTDINKLIDAYDAIHLSIPGFSIGSAGVSVPGVGTVGAFHVSWPGFSEGVSQIADLPHLAAGGIITRPTLALVGERGPEAVVPLGRSGGVGIDYAKLAEAMALALSKRPTYQINANYRYQDERSLKDDLKLLSMLGAAV